MSYPRFLLDVDVPMIRNKLILELSLFGQLSCFSLLLSHNLDNVRFLGYLAGCLYSMKVIKIDDVKVRVNFSLSRS